MRTAVYAQSFVLGIAIAVSAYAGDLNPPPGPVAPTNRVQLNAQSIAMPYAINQPGSYVLTSDLTTSPQDQSGIIINANDVSLDLNGFTIRGFPGVVGHGIAVNGDGVRIHNGRVADWDNNGIDLAGEGGVVTGCILKGNGAGIRTVGNRNRIEGNHATGNDTGYELGGSNNLLVKNSAAGNGTDYVIGVGNAYGPIINVAAGGDLSTILDADHPWANFSFSCLPSAEICDGMDNDCDGQIDEGVTRPCGSDVGQCELGTETCTNGVFGSCEGGVGPTPEVCDGLDNDCDGQIDEGVMRPCGSDVGQCELGTETCTNGVFGPCEGGVGPTPEVCDGLDNDCDGAVDESDPNLGSPCDGPDSDLCGEGTRSCVSGFLICSDNTSSTLDLCNGIDDDCDPTSADGSEDPQTGTACDGLDSDLCAEGTRSCAGGALTCSDNTSSTLDVCNGSDDDCDPASADGSEDPQTGTACDGPDSDLCAEGTRSCVGGALTCSDNTSSTLDVCNGIDDDCDPASVDGSEDPLNGTACDGADSDLCLEGVRSCSGGALVCSDNTSSTLDVCNGIDDDCDPASADGSEDPLNGTACDGADSDLCLEGVRSCSAGVLVCSDNTGSALDVCNGLNDDCDPASPDGSEDPLNGTVCDGPDTDLCLEGTRSCVGGALTCSDNTGNNVEVCNGIDDDCDGQTDEGNPCPLGQNCVGGVCQ